MTWMGKVVTFILDESLHISLKIQKRRLEFDKIEECFNDLNSDLAEQYTEKAQHTPFRDIKIKNQQAFQVDFTKNAIEKYILSTGTKEIHVVDIGDSAGTHIKKLRKLMEHDNRPALHAVSVNLDPVAVDKIVRGGGDGCLLQGGRLCAGKLAGRYVSKL